MISGRVYVVGDNIDTDQIIPARYLSLVPTVEAEYRELGRYALSGLPRETYPHRLVDPDARRCPYKIVVAGRNFGCGSSREHAPIALAAAGIRAVIAESFARIFFRNCFATGELYPVETPECLRQALTTADEITLDLDAAHVTGPNGRTFPVRPLGLVREVVETGGLFAYARRSGLVDMGGAA